MKVGIFDPYLDDLGGGEKYMIKISQCLAENNDVYIFWDKQEDLNKLKERFLFDFSKIKVAKNIFSKEISRFTRFKESKKYDAIIVLSNGSIPLVFSKKLFIHFQQPLNIKINLSTKLKIKRVETFFCNSYFTKFYIDKSFGINSRVLYPPVELNPKSVKKENIILHVGRFRVRNVLADGVPVDFKKQAFLIEVFKKMVKNGLKNWNFLLAISVNENQKGLFEKLTKTAEGFPIEFLVNKNNSQLWDIYSKAKIYWHASGFGENLEIHPEYAEHFGISTVEAMGAGAVPVVINAGGQKEIVNDGKNGFLWNTLDELIDKTKILIRDQNLWNRMSNEARKRAKFFAGSRFCSDLRKILEL